MVSGTSGRVKSFYFASSNAVQEDEHGIVWRYDSQGDVLSATILDFRELWENNQAGLAHELSKGFHIIGPYVQSVFAGTSRWRRRPDESRPRHRASAVVRACQYESFPAPDRR